MRGPPKQGGLLHFRLGFGALSLDSDDSALNRRFGEIYPEGATGPDGAPALHNVACTVRSLDEPGVAAIAFEDPEPLDSFDFCTKLFPDRGYVPGPEAAAGWRTLALRSSPDQPILAMNGARIVADRTLTWQPFVANLAVNRVLRLQRNVLFFHAASVSVARRGLMFLGPKESGKTTTSLTLASRGHPFFGDEIAAVCSDDRRMLPFRRAASIREGVRTASVTRRLQAGEYPEEKFPDGSARVLANVAELFPEAGAGDATRLRAAFFLRRFGARPRAEPFAFGMEHFALLTPLASSLWGVPGGMRMLQLSRLMKEVSCYHLDPGSPDETAELLESLAKELPT